MTREIFAKRGWLELAQTSLSPRGTKPGIGLISRRSDRRRIGFRPPAAIAIIRTVAVSIAAESWRVHRVGAAPQANPIPWLSDTSSALVPDQAPRRLR